MATTLFLFSLTGCSAINNTIENVVNTSGTNLNEMYSDLSSLISYPENIDGMTNTEISGKQITFTAMLLTEPEIIEFDDGDEQQYVSAAISRNFSKVFLLNVSTIEEVLGVGSIVSITGEIDGYIYETIDNENVKVLDIKAKEMIKKDPSNTPDTTNKISIKNGLETGIFEFQEAEMTTNPFQDVILVYFNFTNEENEAIAPSVRNLVFYQGDTELKTTIFKVDAQLQTDALDGVSAPEKTLPHKTFKYYIVLAPVDPELTVDSGALTISYYDDDFNHLNNVEMAIKQNDN